MLPRPNSKAIDRKARLRRPAAPPPLRPGRERIADFREVQAPWSVEGARVEAARCIQCPAAPCVKACPLGNDIPYALWLLEHGDVDAAAEVFRRTSPMPEICGRVCPHGILCEGACPWTRQGLSPIPIGRLEALAADLAPAAEPAPVPATGRRVTVVGAGPAGLAVAERLAGRGHAVTMVDAHPGPGGLLRWGIPGFKLEPDTTARKIEWLLRRGVRFQGGTVLGRDVTLDDLFEQGEDAVFLGIGAGLPREADLPGAALPGVLQAADFLFACAADAEMAEEGAPAVGPRVAVIGGGDTAMDCLRAAVRLGAREAVCWYRRSEAEMPGNAADRDLARAEGARFEWHVKPVRFLGDARGRLIAMECERTRPGELDASGRRQPVPVPGSLFRVRVDTVLLALGYAPDGRTLAAIPGLETRSDGRIRVNPETGATSREAVWAGGDAVLGPALVVTALAQGLRAAEGMDAWLRDRRSVAAAVRVRGR